MTITGLAFELGTVSAVCIAYGLAYVAVSNWLWERKRSRAEYLICVRYCKRASYSPFEPRRFWNFTAYEADTEETRKKLNTLVRNLNQNDPEHTYLIFSRCKA